MQITNPKDAVGKELIVFDLDGTLSPSKFHIDSEMAELFKSLLLVKKVAVISGGKFEQFEIELLNPLKDQNANYQNLFLFPTCSSVGYKYEDDELKLMYANYLSEGEVEKIKNAFKQAYDEIGYQDPEKTYGEVVENRKSQVSFSALGQDIVNVLGEEGIRQKEVWRTNNDVRPQMAEVLKKLLPEFEVRIGGLTTIDITHKGIDKAYGVEQIQKHLNVPISKMLFIGDAMFPGGNDHAVIKTGIDYIPIEGPEETKKIISNILNI